MNKLEIVSEVVQEICDQMNDPDLIKYADSSDYTGRAMTHLFRAIREVLASPKVYQMTPFDYRGLNQSEEVTIGSSTTETGLVLYSSLQYDPIAILNVHTNSDSSNDQLPYNIIKINSSYPMYAEDEENESSPFYSPKINTDNDRGWYIKENAASSKSLGFQFYPTEGTGKEEYYITVDYLKGIDIETVSLSTVLWIGETGGLFSRRFIDLVIGISVNRLIVERNI